MSFSFPLNSKQEPVLLEGSTLTSVMCERGRGRDRVEGGWRRGGGEGDKGGGELSVTPSLPYWSPKHATRTLVQLLLSRPLPIPCHCVGTQAVLAGALLSPLPLTTPY